MKAVVYEGPHKVAVKQVDDPKITHPLDAVVRITTSAVCGSDLHMYDGRTAFPTGRTLGHEPMGVVEEAGPGLRLVKPGDRVVMPFNISCGVCSNCIRGFTNACLVMNPDQPGAAYGYAGMGPYQGGQAEYVLVPNADWACLKLPGEPGDELEDDFVLLADVFPTGFHAAELAEVKAGSVVVIFGAGPVGLMSAMSAALKGAALIYVVDSSSARLEMAESLGGIGVDFGEGDPVAQIQQHISENQALMSSWRGGEKKRIGADCAIDAVGYEAMSRSDPSRNDEAQVLRDCVRILNATGTLGVIGVYMDQDPGAASEAEKGGNLVLPFGELWSKGIRIGTGQAPAKQYQIQLRDLIIAGIAKPSMIVTDRAPIDQAPVLYAEFDKRDQVIKPVLKAA